MKLGFENHWKHGHFILLGLDSGFGFGKRRYVELTVLNLGFQVIWTVP